MTAKTLVDELKRIPDDSPAFVLLGDVWLKIDSVAKIVNRDDETQTAVKINVSSANWPLFR